MARSEEDEVAALLAERACRRVVDRYAELADAHDTEAFVALFTPDARWARADGANVHGHERIRTTYGGRPVASGSSHRMLGVTVDRSSATEAVARSTAIVFKTAGSGLRTAHLVGYLDRLHRCEDGEWRIADRVTELLAENF